VPERIEFALLGPLEARVGGRVLSLGGPKQRTVLVLLLLRANAVVPVERLVDELWGEAPPASAAHTLETYVSRLRATLERHGVTIVRRGRGYALELGEAGLDAQRLQTLVEAAVAASAAGDNRRAAELAQAADSCWRGRPQIDAPDTAPAPAEVVRLEELWRRALELRVDSDLAEGRHDRVIGDLRALVEEDAYNERLVARLMTALYRSGRQAEAVELYERTRRRISDELGLRPGRELQALSARIVRQEDDPGTPSALGPRGRPRRALGRVGVAAMSLALAAVAAGALWAARDGGGRVPLSVGGSRPPVRVALVLPRWEKTGTNDPWLAQFVDGLQGAAKDYDVQTDILLGDDMHWRSPVHEQLARQIERARYDLVILASEPEGGEPLNRAIYALPRTRFVFVDAYYYPGVKALRQPNVTLLQFADDQAGYLAGYLSGLVENSRASHRNRRPVVSIVAGMRIPQVTGLVDGFTLGVKRAAPRIRVITAYSNDFVDRSRCASLASRQIDGGSDLVFAPAGKCGLGALSVAGLRGALGVGADQDVSYLGQYILGSTIKHFDRAVYLSVRWFLEGTLPRGRPVALGLDDDAVGIGGISPQVSPLLRQQLARAAAQLRQRATAVTRQ
jgi:basic membrane lipoprotein Med (substrate-binding protein (PBP1-ABC) superfamily)/DNA-binding SARP family transcriptional activator